VHAFLALTINVSALPFLQRSSCINKKACIRKKHPNIGDKSYTTAHGAMLAGGTERVDLTDAKTWIPLIAVYVAIIASIVTYHFRTANAIAGPGAIVFLCLALLVLFLFRHSGGFHSELLLILLIIWLAYGMVWQGAGLVLGDIVSIVSSGIIVLGMGLTYSPKRHRRPWVRFGAFTAVLAALVLPNRWNVAQLLSTPIIIAHVSVSCGLFFLTEYFQIGIQSTRMAMTEVQIIVKFVQIGWPLFVHHYTLVLAVAQLLPHLYQMNKFFSGSSKMRVVTVKSRRPTEAKTDAPDADSFGDPVRCVIVPPAVDGPSKPKEAIPTPPRLNKTDDAYTSHAVISMCALGPDVEHPKRKKT